VLLLGMKAAIPIAALTCALIGVCTRPLRCRVAERLPLSFPFLTGTGALAVGEGAVWPSVTEGPS
jgi:hypothetical protein